MGVDVQVSGLAKSFPNGREVLVVFDAIDLSVRDGEIVAISGESGSGKSTLLSLIAGLDAPDSGSINVGGSLVETLRGDRLSWYRAYTVGLVFQFHYLLRDFTALENVMLPALMQRTRRDECERRARELLGSVGLSERVDHLPPQLSGGERQRVAVARALMNDPELVLADEPTGNLDDENSRIVEDTLFRLVSEYGKTLILVTHNTGLADRTGRRLQLEKGCLRER
jgi:lipoprotein-releasing system ATP-binding protein